jgi:hypothetical protein
MAHIIRLTAPSHWAPYLINADASGLEPEDIDLIDHWIWTQTLGAPIDAEPIGYQWHHDAYNLLSQGAECSDFVFRID